MAEPSADEEQQGRRGDGRHVTSPERPSSSSSGVPTTVLDAGTVIGGFRLITPIGQGGMGRVFLAHDEALDRKVALKVLPPEDADDEGRARFLREARALARVDHPHVVHVFASGIDKELAWMALEYIEGDPLCDALASGPLDEETALSLAAQTARGLAAVHEVGVVHRDVKPDNLLLDDSGLVRLVDFGVALFEEPGLTGGFTTRAGVAVGTPHYMAPEQARGGKIDLRADAWGLGATLWALLTGRPPFFRAADEADMDILARVLQEPVHDVRRYAKVSRGTAELVRLLLEKDVEKRPADLRAVAAELEALADEAMQRAESGAPLEDDDEFLDERELQLREQEKLREREAAEAVVSAREAPTPVAGVRIKELTHDDAEGPAPASPDEAPTPAARALVLVGVSALLLAAIIVVVRLATATAPAEAAIDGALEPPSRTLVEDEVDPTNLVLTPPPRTAEVLEDGATEPAPEPGPSDEERTGALSERVRAGGPEGATALDALLDDDDPLAQAAVKALIAEPGAVGSRVVDGIAARRASAHVGALERALFGQDTSRALEAVTALTALRNVEALELLRRASEAHPDVKVRRVAFAASREMFSVED